MQGIDHHGKDKPYPFAEDSLQIACATYLRAQYPNVVWFHSPNGGSRNRIEAAKLKQMGVRPGVSDIVILEPWYEEIIKPGTGICQWKHGLVVELKAKGGKLQDTQASFIMDVQARGFMAAVCWNFDAFKALVDNYLNP